MAAIQMQLSKMDKSKRDVLAAHFYKAIKASLEDPDFKRRFEEWQKKEAEAKNYAER